VVAMRHVVTVTQADMWVENRNLFLELLTALRFAGRRPERRRPSWMAL
jgi:hypothetical protein